MALPRRRARADDGRVSDPTALLPAQSAPGLSRSAAADRLVADGPNELPTEHRQSLVIQFVHELTHFFAKMLWVAGTLAFVAGLPQLGVAIFVVVLVNATFSFVQQRRSDRAAERLRDLLPRQVLVRRDGRPWSVHANEIVVGDLLLLSAGDRICADAVVRVNRGLRVDTSMLTGESESVGAELGGLLNAGTFVIDGEAEAEVVATGARTRLAAISSLTAGTKRPQRPMTMELRRVVRAISAIAVSFGLVSLVVSLLLGTSGSDAIVFSIGVTVALVPEGLLPTVTLSLAMGAQRMANRNALVRHLDAVQTLGSTTFICTDKTGTLTENQMVASSLWTPQSRLQVSGNGYGSSAEVVLEGGHDSSTVLELIGLAARCGTGRAVLHDGIWCAMGDPMEAATHACANRLGLDVEQIAAQRPELRRFPFDASRKRMSVVLGPAAGGRDLADVVVKGAIESVLPLCTAEDLVTVALEEAEAMAERGLRVIAVGRRSVPTGQALPDAAEEAERSLELIGLIGYLDPPRPAAQEALARCRRAGIKVAMITGDHPRTAASIGRAVGLVLEGAPTLLGSDLPSDLDELGALVDHDGIVISRATPEDKLRIAQALRGRGHVVAMTGDGVNDGPALRAASIGVAMGRSGTDVAREAADIVLLDDDFATIIEAVAEGRATFLNVRRFLTYHLTDNVAELTPYLVWALSAGHFPLALTVMQILALDIGTDTASATALGAEPPSRHVLDGPPVSGRLLNHTVAFRAFALFGPIEALMSLLAFVVTYLASGWRPGDEFGSGAVLYTASGAAFLTIILAQKANSWACRSASEPPWRVGWFTNRLLLYTATGELLFGFACLAVPPIADVLDNRFPSVPGLLVAAASIPAVLAADAFWKAHKSRRSNS